MEPRIQYTKTADGVRIALWTLGSGTPLVHMPAVPFSHMQMEWQWAPWRQWYEGLARDRQLIRYDCRGAGLSERAVGEISLQSFVRDVEAVADHLQLDRFDLGASFGSGPVAVAYAAMYPERVRRLVLWCTWVGTSDQISGRGQALGSLADVDWVLYTENLASIVLGWAAKPARWFAEYLRQSVDEAYAKVAVPAIGEFDVTSMLAQIKSPTLVVHRRSLTWPAVDRARRLAAEIPGARLAVLEGNNGLPFMDKGEDALEVLRDFLQADVHPTIRHPSASSTAVILFADIVDSAGLTERLGDVAFRDKARRLDVCLREAICNGGGTPIEGKLLGDGVLAIFSSAREAIDAALHCGREGDGEGLRLHLGIHAGDVLREDTNVYGGAVNIAARISALSAPGELLISETVRSLARTSTAAGIAFEDRGEQELKGIEERVRLWAVKSSTAGDTTSSSPYRVGSDIRPPSAR
jgi:class 3 adenylate cyclase/pimeloyl-ACP methyl ester carboxylesterase